MAYLITNHDKLHIHKICGLYFLLNTIYILFNYFIYNKILLKNDIYTNVVLVCQSMLSITSLQFNIPNKRNFSSPMIWKELRLHSIIFSLRHIMCTFLSIYQINYIFLRLFVVLFISNLATIITNKYGSDKFRTTSHMPYPDSFPEKIQKEFKFHYTLAQFGATTLCFFNNPILNWTGTIGIQIAPLLMTLVRKGKIKSKHYHLFYSFTLWLGNLIFFKEWYNSDKPEVYLMSALIMNIIMRFRINYGINKNIIWLLYTIFTWYINWNFMYIHNKISYISIITLVEQMYIYLKLLYFN